MERKKHAPAARLGRYALRIGVISIMGLLGAAAYAMFVSLPGSIRIAPLSITVNSSGTLPAEVKALEAQTAPLLFDRDTTTAHVAYDDHVVEVKLDKSTEIQSVKVFGPAPYELAVQAKQGSAWSTIAGLDKIRLANQAAAWNRFQATKSVTTGALRFVLTIPSGNGGGGNAGGGKNTNVVSTATAGGIPEIEIWAAGEHALLNGQALVAAMPKSDKGTTKNKTAAKPSQARAYEASTASAVVGKDAQTFKVTLDRPARSFKRAWLTYEAYGLSHWVSPVRRINGLTLQGGAFTFSGSDWTALTEPIHPDWLVAGSNSIEFQLPANVAGTYSVRNVRLVAELDDGNNFIARATAGSISSKSGAETDAPLLVDGDLTSGWSPYFDPHSKGSSPALTLYFDRPTQIDTLSLNLVDRISGTFGVDLQVNGQWQNAGIAAVNGNKLATGWNSFSGFAAVAADALRITFQNGAGSPGEIREISATGSGSGAAYSPAINVGYADAGQFYGRKAYIRGFLSAPDNGTGPAEVAVAGISVPASDGSFGIVVSKEEAGYGSQADAESWQVEVAALYPDGQKLSQIVQLTQGFDASKAHGTLPSMVNPGFAETLIGGDASLEIGADALDKPAKIKITPLADKDLPRLDPGMTNVTKGPHRGYRFTPTPFKFKKNVKVTLPYDLAKVPRGLTEKDIKTYYFDTQAGHWAPLDRVQVDGEKKKITSLTNHFTDMINATLVVPDHPEAMSFNATQIKDIKAADPGAGINLIEPPQANNTGDARLSYPIEIPQGRQGMQPQLAISYNSGGGNGWLGLGWDLSIPSITIETRWGVPRYNTSKESETYLLNGEQLVPVKSDGEMGAMPHRAQSNQLETRSTDKEFHTRVEGQFRKIIRHGATPATYWWEVTDKNGTKNFYGSEGGEGASQDADSVLGSDKGVFKWMLKKTQDANGNYVKYDYARVCDTGTGDGHNTEGDATCEGGVAGYQLYPSAISYTGHANSPARYRVEFIRDANRRPDVSIDARGGFKQVTASRLQRIDVFFDTAQLVRSYELQYHTNVAFGKTLLSVLIQKGSDGTEFNRHAFDYYNDMPLTSGSYAGFHSGPDWDPGSDGIKLRLLGADFDASLVSGTKGRSEGSHRYVGIGFGSGDLGVGVSKSSSSNKTEGLLTLTDMDGDGLPDKVFKSPDGGQFYYRRNTWSANQSFNTPVNFSASLQVSGMPGISRATSSGSTSSIDGRYGYGSAFYGNGSTVSTDALHLNDVNGDGLIDVITESGQVMFGGFVSETPVLGEDEPRFTFNSAETEAIISSAGQAANGTLPNVTDAATQMLRNNPLMDVLKRWDAPWGGSVKISGTVVLKNSSIERAAGDSEYKTADGVRVSVEHHHLTGAPTVLWAKTIAIADEGQVYDPATAADDQGRTLATAVSIARGERLYFRVQSRYDGAYDEVLWTPRIEYTGKTALLDVNNRDVYRYDAGEDFTLGGRRIGIPITYTGKLRLEGVLSKLAQTSDDVRFEMTLIKSEADRNDETKVHEVSRKTLLVKQWRANETGSIAMSDIPKTASLPDFPEFSVEKDEMLEIRFRTDSNIDLTALEWRDARLYYTQAVREGGSYAPPPTTAPTVDEDSTGDDLKPVEGEGEKITIEGGAIEKMFDDNGPIYNLPASYDMDMYPGNTLTTPQTAWKAPKDGVLLVTPWVKLVQYKTPVEDSDGDRVRYTWQSDASDGDIAFTVKRRGELVAKKIVKVRNNSLQVNGYQGLMLVPVKKGDELFFDVSVQDSDPLTDKRLAKEIESTEFRSHYGSADAWRPPFSDDVKINPSFHVLLDDEDDPSSGKVIFLVRRGDKVLVRKDFAVEAGNDYSAELPLDVVAEDSLSYDFFTADDGIEVTNNKVWTTYPGPAAWSAPRTGTIEIHPELTFKADSNTSGTFTLAIYNNSNNQFLAMRNYAVSNGIVSDPGTPLTLSVSTGSTLRFEYGTEQHELSSDLAERGQVRIDYADKAKWTVPAEWDTSRVGIDLDVAPALAFDFGAAKPNGAVHFGIWRGAEQLGEMRLDIVDGALSVAGGPLRLNARGEEELTFIFTSANAELIPYLQTHSAKVTPVGLTGVQAVDALSNFNFIGLMTEASALHILMPQLYKLQPVQGSVRHTTIDAYVFPSPYRGWSTVAYNGNGDSCLQKVKIGLVEPGVSCSEPTVNEANLAINTDSSSFNSQREETIFMAFPEVTHSPLPVYQHWRSLDEQWSVKAGSMTPSRSGDDYVAVPNSDDFTYVGAVRVPRMSRADTTTWGAGYGISYNHGDTDPASGLLDMIDLNGDRYPDIVTTTGALYTLPDGGLDSAAVSVTNFGDKVRKSSSTSDSFSLAPSRITSDVNGQGKEGAPKPPANVKEPERIAPPIGLGAGTSSSDGTHDLIDVNGDGLPDRVYQSGSNLSVSLNLGYEFAPQETWEGTATLSKGGGMNASASTPGLPEAPPTSPSASPTGSFSGGLSLSGDVNMTEASLMDMNGDGLADFVSSSNDNLYVGLNTGTGFASAIRWSGAYTDMMDRANEGRSFTLSANVSASVFIPIPIIQIGVALTYGRNWADTISRQQVGLRDMNGDGLPDSIKSTSESELGVALNKTGKTNLLKQVRRPLGARFDIDYIRTGNTYEQPQSKWVMSEVRMFDGVAEDTPPAQADWDNGSDWQRFTFAYEGGKYDRFEREFLGFDKVVSNQHDTKKHHGASLSEKQLDGTSVYRRTEQLYANSSFYDKGLLLNEKMFAGSGNGELYTETVNQYEFWKLGDALTATTDLVELDRFTAGATATLFPRLTRTDKKFYEGGSQALQSSYTEHVYDTLGNITRFKEGGTDVQEVTADIEYAYCEDKYVVGKANKIIVTGNGEMRRRTGFINCASGNLDWQRAYIDASTYAETNFTWDQYGNLDTVLGPENQQGQQLLLDYTYDDEDGTYTYPTRIDNIRYGIHSTATYDPKWGKALTTTDTNGNEIVYTYDNFGRTETVLGPQEQAANQDYTIRFTYEPYIGTDPEVTPQASYAKTEHADRGVAANGNVTYKDQNPIDTVLFTDGLKRVLQTKKDATVAESAGSPAQDMMIVSGRTALDPFGRTVAQYYPTAQPKGSGDEEFDKGFDETVKPTVTTYDVLDRAELTTLPDDTSTTMEYGFGADDFGSQRFMTTVMTGVTADTPGNRKRSYRDVRELITTVKEENRPFNNQGEATSQNKAEIVTRYIYDPLRQITHVIDAQGNTTSVEYDNLGRRTAIDNPDTGRVETEYDLASNPIRKITPNIRAMGADKAIEYTYDYTRLLSITYPGYSDANVTYVYGTDADRAHNQAGRIKSVTHQSGTETREYGTLGETVKETLTLTAAANGGSTPPVYTTQYSFDSFGRLHTVTMPDNEVITHRYDSGGNLNSIDGRLNGHPYQYLERLDYDKFEQRVYLKVGNGVVTKYTYDPNNRRLETLKAGFPGKGLMQDMTYGYDLVGNITSLIDSAPIPKSNVYGGKSTQTFEYDDLYRLVKADGVYTTAREEQTYTLAMAYDTIHNITHKNQLHTAGKVGGTSPKTETATTYDWGYTYGAGEFKQPHAPTHIGERTFEYDANGNQHGWKSDANGSRRTIVWDDENRIREVQDPKHGAAFSYDDKGERKLRKSQYGETAYISQYFSVRNGAIASTHVFAGTSRIVTKVGAGTPVGKVTTTIQGTNNLTDIGTTALDVIVITADGTTTTTTPSPLGGEGRGEGHTTTTTSPSAGAEEGTATGHPGQGLEHRSDRANEVARNTQKNKHLNGGTPGGEHGSANSNKGGHGNPAGTSNNPGANTGTGGGDTGGGNGTGGSTGGGTTGGTGTGDGMEFIYFYHPDHLGSTGYVTDEKAQRYEHITYFPFGETWVQEATATWRVPYQFTSKEMDPETGLYYFGARYYDPRTSVWQSADPILDKYLPTGNKEQDAKLAGMGGAFNSLNLAMYTYGHQNPVRLTDPDGNAVIGVPFTDKYLVLQQKPGGGWRAEVTTKTEGRHIDPAPGGLLAKQQVTFKNDDPNGASTDQKVKFELADMVEDTLDQTKQSININSTTGGTHSSPRSNHYKKLAIDYNTVDGKGVGVRSNAGNVEKLQKAFDQHENVRENFGPAFKHKTLDPDTRNNNFPVGGHQGHGHLSAQPE